MKTRLNCWLASMINQPASTWASNLGVFAADHASLDYRLRDSQAVQSLMVDQLRMLETYLEECECYFLASYVTDSSWHTGYDDISLTSDSQSDNKDEEDDEEDGVESSAVSNSSQSTEDAICWPRR